jgi:ribosomal-protein-alanine N-acetyltransferase
LSDAERELPQLEPAELDDLPAILELERAAYTHPWSEAGLREALADPKRFRTLVLREPGCRGDADRGLRGYCIAQHVADELHVHNVAVVASLRRRGLARRLLLHVLDEAREAGVRVALLEVREGNAAARALYESLGFDAVGHRRGYYTSPAEDALVLQKTLS